MQRRSHIMKGLSNGLHDTSHVPRYSVCFSLASSKSPMMVHLISWLLIALANVRLMSGSSCTGRSDGWVCGLHEWVWIKSAGFYANYLTLLSSGSVSVWFHHVIPLHVPLQRISHHVIFYESFSRTTSWALLTVGQSYHGNTGENPNALHLEVYVLLL